MKSANRQVFINVPFDNRYKRLFDALVFAVHACGLEARCALERDSGGDRIDKVIRLIGECRYGIHDLSRVTLDAVERLPRFNMPFELGIFLGARYFGGTGQQDKAALILERDPFRYRIFCSDLAGHDIRAHHNDVRLAMSHVRNWLIENPAKHSVPGDAALEEQYLRFLRQLPYMCREEGLKPDRLSFNDYKRLVTAWIDVN